MRLGDLEFHVISDGHVLLDGGAMFGVIPRPLWEKKIAPDARNRIVLSMNCLLIQASGKRILVETGAGGKMSSKLRDIYGLDGPRLDDGLQRYGLRAEDINIVINTHLHFDHCGGNTRVERDRVVPAYPNARYVIPRGEYEHASHPSERDSAIVPGVEVIRVPGHTADMQCVKLTGGGKTAFFLADLVPTRAHLPLPWIMGYDLYPMTTLENKKRWLPEVAREGWIALFAHDSQVQAAYLRERDGEWDAEPVTVD